ncbi:MAG: IPT/TIG domain-containing protein [Thermoanaerobaculia bacterium]
MKPVLQVVLAASFLAFSTGTQMFAQSGTDDPSYFGVIPPGQVSSASVRDHFGDTAVRIDIFWSETEPSPGLIVRRHEDIQAAENAGLAVFPVIRVGRGWMNTYSSSTTQETRSLPPQDLLTEADPNFGYSRTYYQFVSDLFTQYKGHFDYVAIESDPLNEKEWGGTADEYVRLVKTASKAIRDTDPDVRIADGGISGEVWALEKTWTWIISTPQETSAGLDFAYRFMTTGQSAGSIDPRLSSPTAIADYLRDADSPFRKHDLPMLETIVDGISGKVDALNILYAKDPQFLPAIAERVRERSGLSPQPYTPDIVSTSIAIRPAVDSSCDSPSALDRDAIQTVESVVESRAAGLVRAIWDSTRSTCGSAESRAAFFDESGTLQPSGRAFRLATNALDRAPRFVSDFSAPGQYHQLVFNERLLDQPLVALWSDTGPRTMSLGTGAAVRAVLTDHRGVRTVLDILSGHVTLPVSEPVLVKLVRYPGLTPVVYSVAPATGPAVGGTPVTIRGSELTPDIAVMFDGHPAPDVHWINGSTVVVVTPAGNGKADLVLINSDGQTVRVANAYTYQSDGGPPPDGGGHRRGVRPPTH